MNAKDLFFKCNSFIDKKIYSKKLIYVLIFIISLIMPTLYVLEKGQLFDIEDELLNFIEFLLLVLNADLIVFNILKRECKIEHIFLSLILPIGLAYMIFLVPNTAPDEAGHSYRIYDISQGNLITKKRGDNSAKMLVPQDLVNTLDEVHTYKETVQSIRKKTNYNEMNDLLPDATTAAVYPFFGYTPAAFAFFLCSVFGINIVIAYYIARLLTFMFSVYVLFNAIKYMPFGKLIMLFYLFNPMFLQQLVSLTFDSLLNAISLLLISYIFYKLFTDKKLEKKDTILFCLLCFPLAASKFVYLPLIFLLLFLCDKRNKQNNKKIYVIVLVSVIISIIMYLFQGTYVSYNSYVINNGVNSSEQIKFILNNPKGYINVLLNTTVKMSSFYFDSLFGRSLGPFTIYIHNLIPIFYAYILLFIPFFEKSKFDLKWKQKISIIVVMAIVYLAIETGLYLCWSPVGGPEVVGVQGRYFIPIFIFVPLMLINKKNTLNFKHPNLIVCFSILLVNLVSLMTIFKFFNY